MFVLFYLSKKPFKICSLTIDYRLCLFKRKFSFDIQAYKEKPNICKCILMNLISVQWLLLKHMCANALNMYKHSSLDNLQICQN